MPNGLTAPHSTASRVESINRLVPSTVVLIPRSFLCKLSTVRTNLVVNPTQWRGHEVDSIRVAVSNDVLCVGVYCSQIVAACNLI
jgi:hypothetical protein